MFQTKVDKIKTHFMSILLNLAVIEKTWSNIKKPDWPQMTV